MILSVRRRSAISNGESQSAGRELSIALSVNPDGLDPQRTSLPVHFRLPIIYTIRSSGQYRWFSEGRAGPEVGGIGGWSDTDVSLAAGCSLHNGDICDAQAVVASFQRLKEEESPALRKTIPVYVFCSGCGYCGSNL